MEQANKWINPIGRIKGVFYGWWMVGFGALVVALSNVPLFQGITVWNPVLKGHFAWSSAQVTWGFALTRAEGSLTGPMSGYLIDRFGSRRMVFVGLLIQGMGFVLFSRIQGLWGLLPGVPDLEPGLRSGRLPSRNDSAEPLV